MSSSLRRYVLAFVVGSMLMLPIFFGRDWVDSQDSYYHLRMARMLPEIGATRAFPWLHWTFFRDQFVNHHLGFQAALLPFAWLSEQATGDLVRGGQVMAALCMGTTCALLLAILLHLGVPRPMTWVLLLGAAPWHFWLRMSYIRAPILALPLLLLALLLILKRRPVALAVLGAIFLNVYFGAVVFALVPIAMVGGRLLSPGASLRDLIPGIAAGIGLGAGLFLNPYFPDNIEFLRVQIFSTGLGAPDDVGNEWKSYNAWFLLKMCGPFLVLGIAALVARLRSREPFTATSLGLLFLNLAFLALTVKARRFVEYWPVFALINMADLGRNLVPARYATAILVFAAGIACVGPFKTRHEAEPAFNVAAYRDAMHALEKTSPKGALVFLDDWDAFPGCFYFNQHNRYVVGLDPMFTAKPYPDLWDTYRAITRGQAVERLAEIRDTFGAQYVTIEDDHRRLYRQVRTATNLFEMVYPDTGTPQPPLSIFRTRP